MMMMMMMTMNIDIKLFADDIRTYMLVLHTAKAYRVMCYRTQLWMSAWYTAERCTRRTLPFLLCVWIPRNNTLQRNATS